MTNAQEYDFRSQFKVAFDKKTEEIVLSLENPTMTIESIEEMELFIEDLLEIAQAWSDF